MREFVAVLCGVDVALAIVVIYSLWEMSQNQPEEF